MRCRFFAACVVAVSVGMMHGADAENELVDITDIVIQTSSSNMSSTLNGLLQHIIEHVKIRSNIETWATSTTDGEPSTTLRLDLIGKHQSSDGQLLGLGGRGGR